MNRSTIHIGLAAVSVGLVSINVSADTLVVHSTEQQGEFGGYEDGRFLFQAAGRARVKEPRTSVQKLVLERPSEVTLIQGTKTQLVRLVGYDQSKFLIEAGGTQSEVAGMLVRSITVRDAAATEGGNGGSGPQPRRALDLSGIDESARSPSQAAALARYKAAWKAYSDFLAQSSAMVAEMDKTQGARRVQLLNALRARRTGEQPLLSGVDAAEKVLRAAIPKGAAARTKPEPAAGGPALPPRAIAVLPDVPEGEPVIIDTSSLEAVPNLTPSQRETLSRYKSAVARFTALTDAPGSAGPDVAAARQQLQKEQKALLAAFPGMSLK